MKEFCFEVEFVEGMLGTKPANAEVFGDYVASKNPKGTPARDELEAAEKVEVAGTTVFHRTPNGEPCLYDYQIKGFFKDACGGLRRVPGTKSAGIKAYKSIIDSLVFVFPRMIPLDTGGQPVAVCERPLRCETMQGPRVALARSEEVPAGTRMKFFVKLLNDELEAVLNEWIEYGALRGIGQWRNSGKGRFRVVNSSSAF